MTSIEFVKDFPLKNGHTKKGYYANVNNNLYKLDLTRTERFYPTGEIERIKYYTNGVILSKYTYQNDLKHGHCIQYKHDGMIMEDYYYDNNKLDGECKSFWLNGKLKDIGVYVNGLAEGEHIQYEKNGTIKEKCKYINGQMHGLRSLYLNGTLYAELTYEDNNLIKEELK